MSASRARRIGWASGRAEGLRERYQINKDLRNMAVQDAERAENRRRYDRNFETMTNREKVNDQRYAEEKQRRIYEQNENRSRTKYLDRRQQEKDEQARKQNEEISGRNKVADARNEEIFNRQKQQWNNQDYDRKVDELAGSLFSDPERVKKYESEGMRHLAGIDANMDGVVSPDELAAFNSKGNVKAKSVAFDPDGSLNVTFEDGGSRKIQKAERDAIKRGFASLDDNHSKQNKMRDEKMMAKGYIPIEKPEDAPGARTISVGGRLYAKDNSADHASDLEVWKEENRNSSYPVSFADWKKRRENPAAGYNDEAAQLEESIRVMNEQKQRPGLAYATQTDIDKNIIFAEQRLAEISAKTKGLNEAAFNKMTASGTASPAAAPGAAAVNQVNPAAEAGSPAPIPQPGEVRNGWSFRGGDTKDPKNWVKASGQTAEDPKQPVQPQQSPANAGAAPFNSKGYVDNLKREAAWIDRTQPQTVADAFRTESGFRASATDPATPSQPQTLGDRFRAESGGSMPANVLVGPDGSWFYPQVGSSGEKSWTSKSGVTVSANDLRNIDIRIAESQARLLKETDPSEKARLEEFIEFALTLKPQFEKLNSSVAMK